MNRARTVILLAIACVAAAAARGQEWRGPASLGVEVKGKPQGSVEGALVILRYQQMQPPAGPRPVLTDAAGRAVVADLAPGVWEVEVSHEDFLSFVALVALDGGRKPSVQASFLQASGSSLTPIRVKFSNGHGRAPSASVPLPPEAAARLAARRPPPPPEPPAQAPTQRRAGARRPPDPVMPEPELRPLPPTAQPATVPAPPEPAAPEPAAPAAPGAAPQSLPAAAAPPPAVTEAPEPAEQLRPASIPPAEPAEAAASPQPTAEPAPAPEPPPVEPEVPPAPAPEPFPPGGPEASPAPSSPAAPEASRAPSSPAAPEAPPAPSEPQPMPSAPTPAGPEPAPPAVAPAEAPRRAPAPAPQAAPPVPEAAAQSAPEPTVGTPEPDAAILPPPGPLGPTLRAYRDRTCVECRPGEWALSVETIAGPSGGPCDEAALAADGAALAELLGGSIALELKEIAAPAPVALGEMEAGEAVTRAAGLLGDASSSCRVVAVVIPKAGRFRGLRMEAADGSGIGDCQADRDCPVGRARWLGQPRVSREPSANVIWGVFVNRAPDRARRARLTVYFAAPYRAWDPTR